MKHRILFNVGTLTDEQAQQLRLAIQVRSDPSLVVAKEADIVVTKSIQYLNVMCLHHLWQFWGFPALLPNDRWVEALVINRCVDPISKIQLQTWTRTTVLPVVIPALRIYDEYDVYRELDRLAKRVDDVQRFLYQQLRKRGKASSDAFFYDITSSYFEGSRCVIAKLGYSRDHRPDREQIVIALMITPEGYPFYWRVLTGNTQDITTIESLVSDIKQRFGIEHCTLVFDRGMVSADNLQTIGHGELQYVSAMDADEIRTTLLDDVMPDAATPDDFEQVLALREFQRFDENAFLYYRPMEKDHQRYVVTFDVQRFYEQTRHRRTKMEGIEQWILQTNEALRSAQKSRNRDIVERDVSRMLARKGLKKQANVTIEPISVNVTTPKGKTRTVNSFHIKVDWLSDRLQEAARLDGLTVFLTNIPKEQTDDREVIRWYRRKNKVEEAFHEIKSHLQLRPMHVTRSERVKAHVAICILASFLYNDMEQLLRTAGEECSPSEVLESFRHGQVHRIEIPTGRRKILKVQEASEAQQRFLQALDCETIVEEGFKKRFLKLAENWL